MPCHLQSDCQYAGESLLRLPFPWRYCRGVVTTIAALSARRTPVQMWVLLFYQSLEASLPMRNAF